MHLYANKWNKIIDKTVFMHILETKFETILWAKKIINTCNSWKILLGEKPSMCGTSIIQRNFWEKKPITLNGTSLGTIQCNNTIISTST